MLKMYQKLCRFAVLISMVNWMSDCFYNFEMLPYKPGCQLRECLVLKGDQNSGKSKLFRALAGEDWFDDSISLNSDKDDRLKLANCWIAELAEIETITGKKENGVVKAFIAQQIDIVRVPYDRTITRMPRTSVFVGTVNEDEFLTDSTGDTRWLVMDIGAVKPNYDWVLENRDAIWAYALQQYEVGSKYWLDKEEDQRLQAKLNTGGRKSDPWEEWVASELATKPYVMLDDVHTKIVPDLEKRNALTQKRVTDIMKKLGWKPVQRKIDGKKTRCWEHK